MTSAATFTNYADALKYQRKVTGRSLFRPKPKLNLDPHTAEARSRRWGYPDGIPYDYRHLFTAKRAAVINFIAKRVKHTGKCDLPNATIARKVGVCIRTVQRAKADFSEFCEIATIPMSKYAMQAVKHVVVIVDELWKKWLSNKASRRPACHPLERIDENLSSFFVRPARESHRIPP